MGYLDEYSEKETQRERQRVRLKRALLITGAVLVMAGILLFLFKNYREERRVKDFLSLLERGDYQTAYSLWGCRPEAPCPNYTYKDFLEDWGAQGEVGRLQSYRLRMSRERGSGVMVPVILNGRVEKKLWVEKSNGVLGFAPPF